MENEKSSSVLTENQRIFLVIRNQESAIDMILEASVQSLSGIRDLKTFLVEGNKSNYERSIELHKMHCDDLDNWEKFSDQHHEEVGRILRGLLFTEDSEDKKLVNEFIIRLQGLSGVERATSFINKKLENFDEIRSFIINKRLSSFTYEQINEDLKKKFGIGYNSDTGLATFIGRNRDQFPELLEFDAANTTRIRSEAAGLSIQKKALMPYYAGMSIQEFFWLTNILKDIEKWRIDETNSWQEISVKLKNKHGIEYKDDRRSLQNRVSTFIDLGLFDRLNRDLLKSTNSQVLSEKRKSFATSFEDEILSQFNSQTLDLTNFSRQFIQQYNLKNETNLSWKAIRNAVKRAIDRVQES
jgi:hypothetical protein